jgi:hypothetical protein
MALYDVPSDDAMIKMLTINRENIRHVGTSTANAMSFFRMYLPKSIPHPRRHKYRITLWKNTGIKISKPGTRPAITGFNRGVLSEKIQYMDGRHNARGTACGVITITRKHIKRKTPMYSHRVLWPLLIRGIVLVVYGKRQHCHDPCPFYLQSQLFLMTRTGPGYSSWEHLSSFCNKILKNMRGLIVDGEVFVFTESACFSFIICPLSGI